MAQQTTNVPEVIVELKTGTDVNALVIGVLEGTPQANAFLANRPKISRMPGPILNVDQERQLANLPDHPFAKIRRTLVLSYPRGTNLAAAVQRLRLDARVQSVQADDAGGTLHLAPRTAQSVYCSLWLAARLAPICDLFNARCAPMHGS